MTSSKVTLPKTCVALLSLVQYCINGFEDQMQTLEGRPVDEEGQIGRSHRAPKIWGPPVQQSKGQQRSTAVECLVDGGRARATEASSRQGDAMYATMWPPTGHALAHIIPSLARKESCIRKGGMILVLQNEGINKN